MFKRGEHLTQLSNKSRTSIEYLPGAQTNPSTRARKIPIWEVAEIGANFYYDVEDDHVGFISLVAYDKNENECRIDRNSVSEDVFVEWREKKDGTIWVSYVFFHGEEGTYIFSVDEEAKIR